MKNRIVIRRAAEKDLSGIIRLNREDLGYDYDSHKALKRLQFLSGKPDHCILVAIAGKQVAGYIHACDYDPLYHDPMKNIMGLAVGSSFRRMGAGRKLLLAVEEWAREDGAAGVRLTSNVLRKDAHLFYASCGYTKTKEQYHFTKRLIP